MCFAKTLYRKTRRLNFGFNDRAQSAVLWCFGGEQLTVNEWVRFLPNICAIVECTRFGTRLQHVCTSVGVCVFVVKQQNTTTKCGESADNAMNSESVYVWAQPDYYTQRERPDTPNDYVAATRKYDEPRNSSERHETLSAKRTTYDWRPTTVGNR